MFYSYDIFDTILYRRVPKSVDIFRVMEPRVQGWNAAKGTFRDIRQKSEFWLRRKSKGEITIEDIYTDITKRSGVTVDPCIELEVEKEQSFLNTSIVNEIKQHIVSGEKVVLISDMYWHETQLREWLSSKDIVFENIPIYVSCDHGATKANGKLFAVVKNAEKVNTKEWLHTGDNKKADEVVPQKLGIKTVLLNGGRRFAFESKIGNKDMNMLATYGIVAEARVKSNGDAFDMGVSVAAPMVYQYVDWVINQSLKKKKEKLYFVLRDGYILKIIADRIIEARGLNIKTEFLFGSRVAWRFPEITIEKLHKLSVWDKSNWIFRDPAVAYIPFERMGFSKSELDDLFGEAFGKKELHAFSEFKTVLEDALQNEEFVSKLEDNIREAGENLDQYLMSTIDFSSSFALVDTNSTGMTQADLNTYLQKKHKGIKDLVFFYHTYLVKTRPDDKTQYVFLSADSADRRFPEAFFRAPFNPCYGYCKTEKGIEPKFHESEKCAWNYSFDYDSYLAGIVSFTETMEKHAGESINLDSYVQFLLKVVNFDITSEDVIKQAAKMPFNPDMNGDEILDFYPELKWSAVLHPFSELIYYPKGSYYNAGGLWIPMYKMLFGLASLRRSVKK